MWTIAIRSHFDCGKEGDPRFVFRTLRSQTLKRYEWQPSDTKQKQWEASGLDLPFAGGVMMVDLFANTISVLDRLSLPCRRFLATACVTVQDIREATWVSSCDMVDGNVKFEIRVTSQKLKDTKTLEAPSDRLFQMCLKSNQALARVKWAYGGLRTYNTSYVDVLLDKCKRPVPGWIDLMHLTLSAAPMPMIFFQRAFLLACRRMNVSPDLIGKHPVLDVEILCDAAAWHGRRSVYVHDTVLTECSTVSVDVDHYGFPRLIDRPEQAGDDCESQTKETILFLTEFRQHARPSAPSWLQHMHDVVTKYCVLQVTGGIHGQGQREVPVEEKKSNLLVKRAYPAGRLRRCCDKASAATATGGAFSSASVSCHSWAMIVPVQTHELWVERGRQWVAQQKGSTCPPDALGDAPDLEWPVCFIESTEYTASAPVVFEDEEKRVQFCRQFSQFECSEAFRYKIPWSTLQQLDRYIYVTTAVSNQSCSKCTAREFLLGDLVRSPDDTCRLQGGVRAQHLLDRASRLRGSSLAMFPVFSPSDKDLEDAKLALEWYPPIFPLPYRADTPMPQSQSLTGVRITIDAVKWSIYKDRFAEWAERMHMSFVASEYEEWKGCASVEIEVHY